MSVCLPAYLSVCPSTSLSVCMSVCLTLCLYVRLSVYLSWNFYSHSIVFYFILDIHVTLVLSFIHVCILQQRKYLYQLIAVTYIFCPFCPTAMVLTLLSFCLLMHGPSFSSFLTLYLLYFTFYFSMATVCGCCLAMLDAGVPLKSSVAGVAMGLILGK